VNVHRKVHTGGQSCASVRGWFHTLVSWLWLTLYLSLRLVLSIYVYCVPCLVVVVLCLPCVLSALICNHPSCLCRSLVPHSVLVGSLFPVRFSVTCSVSLLAYLLPGYLIKYSVPGFNHHRHLPGCPAFGSSPPHNRKSWVIIE